MDYGKNSLNDTRLITPYSFSFAIGFLFLESNKKYFLKIKIN
ncbi:hypothetical protein [Clostridium tetani]|nr:hypothetical protein [Clostridium tetani]